MKEVIKFLARYIFVFTPISLISLIFTPLTLYGTYLLLGMHNPVLDGIVITLRGIRFTFIEACIASYAYYLIIFLVMTTRNIKLKTRIYMILIGFGFILGMNYLRIFGMIIGTIHYGFGWFNTVHMIIWKFFSWIYVFIVWIFLIKLFKVKSIPIYDDFKYFYKRSLFKKKWKQ